MAEHYFSADPAVASRPVTVRLRVADLDFELLADRGVFSSGRVDPGTAALLREAPRPPNAGQLLDLGCGYGPIACALARWSPGATVWAVDVNSRAVQLTADNAQRLGLFNLKAVRPDEVPNAARFRAIWSNPPVRVGKTALHELLRAWLPRLEQAPQHRHEQLPGQEGEQLTGQEGEQLTGHGDAQEPNAWLVANRHLGGDSLAAWLREEGWMVDRAASKSGYRILRVSRPNDNSGA